MCDLTRIKILWHELLPYVDVRPCGHDVINRTGVLYDFFRESLADCCNLPTAIDYLYDDSRLANQQMVLNGVHSTISTVGMPISLDAEFPHTPKEFVPVLQTDGIAYILAVSMLTLNELLRWKNLFILNAVRFFN